MTDQEQSIRPPTHWTGEGLRASFARYLAPDLRESLSQVLEFLYDQQLECGSPEWKGPSGSIRDQLVAVALDLQYCHRVLEVIESEHRMSELDSEDAALSLATRLRVQEVGKVLGLLEAMIAWEPSEEMPLPPSDRL